MSDNASISDLRDFDWVYEQYHEKDCSLADIKEKVGCSWYEMEQTMKRFDTMVIAEPTWRYSETEPGPIPDEPLADNITARALTLRRRQRDRGLTETERDVAAKDVEQLLGSGSELISTLNDLISSLEVAMNNLADAADEDFEDVALPSEIAEEDPDGEN